MLLIREGVDGGNSGKSRKGFDIRLFEGSDYGTVDHPSKDPGRVLDRLAPS